MYLRKKIASVLLLLWTIVVSAATGVVVPVVTARYKDRIYSTTMALKNTSGGPVTYPRATHAYQPPDTAVSRVDVPAKQTLVIERLLEGHRSDR